MIAPTETTELEWLWAANYKVYFGLQIMYIRAKISSHNKNQIIAMMSELIYHSVGH